MHHRMGRMVARTLAIAFTLLIALPASAAAFDFGPAPVTGPITATLPLLGSSLKVDVATDDAGNLTSVALDPISVDPGGAFTATALRPHAVKFETADGSVKVTITSWGGNTSIAAKATTLADLEGAGTWSADVFGTGDATTVKYTIGHDGAGAPTITVDDVSAPGAITQTVGTPTTKTRGSSTRTKVGIKFEWQGWTRTLSIGVVVVTKDDKSGARLEVSLGGRNKQVVKGSIESLIGSHTWKGKLCDGTAIGVAFQVVSDGNGGGKVTYDPDTFATGAEAHAKDLRKGKGFVAIFDGKRAAVLVWLKKVDDSSWKLVVGSFAGRWCKGTTIANPTVNTPVAENATKGGSDGKGGWDFWWGGREGRHHGDHGWGGH